MKILYFDCFSGISGDMALGALLDLGLDADALRAQLGTLNVPGWSLAVERTEKHGIQANYVRVRLEGEDSRAHDPGHGHHHDHHDDHHHRHAHDHAHPHEDRHDHEHDPHGHEHRSFADIAAIIGGSGLSPRAKQTALDIFGRVAQAEGRVHGLPADQVRFHEVGAVDSIVDIAGVAVLMDMLDVDACLCSAVRDGQGFVRCQHGMIPVPVPAVVQIFADPKIRMRQTDIPHELVTPTGAGIVAALCERFGTMPEMRIDRVGYGAGKRDLDIPNVLRVVLGEAEESAFKGNILAEGDQESVTVLEANLDDCPAELLGYAMERLLEAGARDAFFAPIQMKKNRPGTRLTVLCADSDAHAMADILFAETSTIGVRMRQERRIVLPREAITVDTPFGPIAGKRTEHCGARRSAPEYESAREAARRAGVPLREVYEAFEKNKE